MRLTSATLAVFFPLMAMVVWILSLNLAIMFGEEVLLSVSGYDPRDLLSGHYLRYRIEYGMSPDLPTGDPFVADNNLCICLRKQETGDATASWFGWCKQRDATQCPLFIKGRYQAGTISAGIERYYIPERYQHVLAQVPPDAKIKVRVTRSGVAYVTDMYVGKTPILEWVRSQPSAP